MSSTVISRHLNYRHNSVSIIVFRLFPSFSSYEFSFINIRWVVNLSSISSRLMQWLDQLLLSKYSNIGHNWLTYHNFFQRSIFLVWNVFSHDLSFSGNSIMCTCLTTVTYHFSFYDCWMSSPLGKYFSICSTFSYS